MWKTIVFLTGCVAALEETVFLHDVTHDSRQRNLDGGLPSTLEFTFKRRGSDVPVTLTLRENARLNANAPMFRTVRTASGERHLERVAVEDLHDVKFYHDRRSTGAFQVTCVVSSMGPCRRHVEGAFEINGQAYEISPINKKGVTKRQFEATPHLLKPSKRNTLFTKHDFQRKDNGKRRAGTLTHYQVQTSIHRSANPLTSHVKAIELLRSLVRKGKNHSRATDMVLYRDSSPVKSPEKLQVRRPKIDTKLESRSNAVRDILRSLGLKENKDKKGEKIYAVETLVVLDQSIWKKYAVNNNAEATKYRLRQRYSHIMNGVSLDYESIADKDPNLDIYVTISGFIIHGPNDKGALPSNTKNGLVDAMAYLEGLEEYINSMKKLPPNDHVTLFTALDLYGGNPNENGVIGAAWMSEVCKYGRVAVNEDSSYFETVGTAAHELGHNLGAAHDGDGASARCNPDQENIMTPFSIEFDPNAKYTSNPWRFSSCSIAAFKKFIGSLQNNCLANKGTVWNPNEYKEHLEKLPGERYSPDEQCRLLNGANSGLCSSTPSNTMHFCRLMRCKQGNTCTPYMAAARGTPCGPPNKKLWCIEGQCVSKDKSKKPNTTNAPSVKTTTDDADGVTSDDVTDATTYFGSDATTDFFSDTTTDYFSDTSTEWKRDLLNLFPWFKRNHSNASTTSDITTENSFSSESYWPSGAWSGSGIFSTPNDWWSSESDSSTAAWSTAGSDSSTGTTAKPDTPSSTWPSSFSWDESTPETDSSSLDSAESPIQSRGFASWFNKWNQLMKSKRSNN